MTFSLRFSSFICSKTFTYAATALWLSSITPVSLVSIAFAEPSLSTSSASLQEAQNRYKRAKELYEEENFHGALTEFRRAYELTKAYKILYNVAQVCYQLHNYVCAYESFERYRTEGGSHISSERLQEVEAEIQKLQSRIGLVVIETETLGAEVFFDDISYGKTPIKNAIKLNTGQHKLVVFKERKIPISQVVEVAGAETRKITLRLIDSVRVQHTVVVPTVSSEPSSRWTAWSWVGVASTGAFAITAAVTGALALGDSNTLKSMRYTGAPSYEAVTLQSRIQALRLVSDIFTGAAVLTLGATLWFTLSRSPQPSVANQKPKDNLQIRASVGLGNISLIGEF